MPRVGAFLEKRAAGIVAEREAADEARDEAERLKALFEEKLAKADEEAAGILREARTKAEAASKVILSEAKANAEAIVASARAQVEAEKEAAFLVFKAEAVALVIQASGKLLGRNLSSEDNRAFAASLLAGKGL